jgi:hypothetical protein
MVRKCMSTCYVLFWIVVVSASDHKDLFVEHVTKGPEKATRGMVNRSQSKFLG